MKATIVGSGRFPIDMLRYDTCFPFTEVDAHKVAETYDSYLRRWEIVIAKYPSNRADGFTDARWESFGCKVTEVE